MKALRKALITSVDVGYDEVDETWYEPETPFEEAILKNAILSELPQAMPVHCRDGQPCEWEADLCLHNEWHEGWLSGHVYVNRTEFGIATLVDGPSIPIRFHIGEDPSKGQGYVVEWQLTGKGSLSQSGCIPTLPYLKAEDLGLA